MKKNKKAQVYSFKALSSEAQSEGSLSESRKSQKQSLKSQKYQPNIQAFQISSSQYPNKIKQGIFRHQVSYKKPQEQPELRYEINFKKPQLVQEYLIDHVSQTSLHPKIVSLDQQIEQNVKRRLQLQTQLNQLKKLQNEVQKSQQTLSYATQGYQTLNANNLSSVGIENQFALRNKQTDFIDQMVIQGTLKEIYSKNKGVERISTTTKQRSNEQLREQKINQNIQILTDSNMQTILNNGLQENSNQSRKDFYDLKSFIGLDKQTTSTKFNKPSNNRPKQIQAPTPPSITAIQQLFYRLTFPEVPKQNIEKLYKKCQNLYAIHQSHSDLVYLMMLGSFHTGDYHGVRKYFKEILTFKKFQLKAYWVAAETEYILENFERCIKMTDFCMQHLDDRFLPRFIYLKAKSYFELGSFTNSIVCYNQLIRIKPKIPEYYLQRAVLYDKLGYEKQCKEDYLMFGILKPQAKQYLQEKILVEENDGKRKQLLQIYKKMV